MTSTVLIRWATVVAVFMVAAIAAVVSYSHMAELALSVGEQWRSYLIPLTIDGLVVSASMALLTQKHAKQPTSPLAWGALGVGVLASLTANVLDARWEVAAVLLAGWAPMAFAVCFELLLQQRKASELPTPVPTVTEAPLVSTPSTTIHSTDLAAAVDRRKPATQQASVAPTSVHQAPEVTRESEAAVVQPVVTAEPTRVLQPAVARLREVSSLPKTTASTGSTVRRVTPAQCAALRAKKLTHQQIADQLGVSRITVIRKLKEVS